MNILPQVAQNRPRAFATLYYIISSEVYTLIRTHIDTKEGRSKMINLYNIHVSLQHKDACRTKIGTFYALYMYRYLYSIDGTIVMVKLHIAVVVVNLTEEFLSTERPSLQKIVTNYIMYFYEHYSIKISERKPVWTRAILRCVRVCDWVNSTNTRIECILPTSAPKNFMMSSLAKVWPQL